MKDLDIQVGDRITYIEKFKTIGAYKGYESGFDVKEVERQIVEIVMRSDKQYRDILKVERIGQNGWYTVYEKEAEILDEVEKEYLSAVIKPFKDKVKFIEKGKYASLLNSSENQYEFIFIRMKGNDEDIDFPKFKKDTMYKGMKLFKKYTLKELGLE